MPKNPDYSKGMIYKLCCKDPQITEIYIGSTINKKNRKNTHKKCCNNSNEKDYNSYKYEFIRDNGGFENFDMILIEAFPCNSKNELISRERYWIETLKPKLNRNIPTRTQREWYEENKTEFNIKQKKYREEHKEDFKKYQKKYREKNKDKINKKSKEYREENKDKIKKYYEKIKCEKCNCFISKCNLKRHQKTMKCKMMSECLFSDED